MNARQASFVGSRLFAIYAALRMLGLLPLAAAAYDSMTAFRRMGSNGSAFGDMLLTNVVSIFELPLLGVAAVYFWYGAGMVSRMICRSLPAGSPAGPTVASPARLAAAIAGWLVLSSSIFELAPIFENVYLGRSLSVIRLVATGLMLALGLVLIIGPQQLWKGVEKFYNPLPEEDSPDEKG